MQKRVTSYAELKEWISVFNANALDIMIIEGSAGSGKSTIAKQSLANKSENDYNWLEGRLSAICLFEKLYEKRDAPVFLDDIDGIYRDKESVNLLKCLCQTWTEKSISWQTKSFTMNPDIPKVFKTKSKVCLITNSWKSLNKHVSAIQDRGILLTFHPSASEIHQYVKTELGQTDVFDQEVYEFIGQFLTIAAEPSIRSYRTAANLKQVGMNWRDILIESFGLTTNEMMIIKIAYAHPTSHNQRSEIFASQSGKSVSTYWRTKDDLKNRGFDLI